MTTASSSDCRRPPTLQSKVARTASLNDRGFSLIEVVIAVVIVGITFAAIMQAFSQTIRSIDRVDVYQVALQHAQNKMNELLLDDTVIGDGILTGACDEAEQFTWRAQMETNEIDDLTIDKTRLSTRLLYIRLTVTFPYGGHQRDLKLFTIKLVRKPKIGEKGYFGD